MWRHLTLVAVLTAPSALGAAPLAPTSKWEVQYSDVACTAKRNFGDYSLAFQPSPFGQTVRYAIEGPGKASRNRQYDFTIETADGGSPIEVSSLVYPLRQKNRRGLFLILSARDAERLARQETLRIRGGGRLVKNLDGLPNSPERLSVEFSLGSMAALTKALATCVKDLQRHWGIVDGKPIGPVDLAKRVKTRRPLFTSDDYPADAMANNQKGTTRYLLMIDESGQLRDCVVEESSGVVSLDAMGCQAMLERARFHPALDEAGKPMKAIQRFTLTWDIRG